MRSDYDKVKMALEYVQSHASQQPTLEQIAEAVSLSPTHFQRVFRRWAGISPKRWLQYLTASEAKRLLRASTPVLDAAYAVGLSGPGRLHDLIVSTEAVTPGEFASRGRELEIRYGCHESPFGRCLIGLTERGICALRFTDVSGMDEDLRQLQDEWSQARFVKDQTGTAKCVETIFKPGMNCKLLLDLKGTNFQLKVWDALLKIPEGCVISYSNLANRLDAPSASRAVANAVGANPIAFLIPCHRVLKATGELGGYRWGVDRKSVMLAREIARSTDTLLSQSNSRTKR
jgi:AraC family transcriptional regulator, regulatory protein of adaptative response / methylated-DNA-[protein]-cysteine methyltransferase